MPPGLSGFPPRRPWRGTSAGPRPGAAEKRRSRP
nr:MAG TPA: hypothetical protein [Caudoviricetes sp.]